MPPRLAGNRGTATRVRCIVLPEFHVEDTIEAPPFVYCPSGNTIVKVESTPGVSLQSTQLLLNSGKRVAHLEHKGCEKAGDAASTRCVGSNVASSIIKCGRSREVYVVGGPEVCSMMLLYGAASENCHSSPSRENACPATSTLVAPGPSLNR
mmetsp:Transcript_10662/g.27398  ORF Transcript_10662/g.27398 Transcript_10662/m.27398 type:complete len:152 (-) Transcript_10662:1614-2069(-)